MECGVVGEPLETPYFIPDIGTHPRGMTLPRTAWVRLNRLAPVWKASAPVYTNGVWPLLRLVSAAQRNRPLTILAFNVQSIDLPVEHIALRFCDDETI